MNHAWVALVLLAAGPVLAAEPPADAVPAETVRAEAALDGRTLRLIDGRVLRLAGIHVPAAPERAAERARAALAGLGGDLTLFANGRGGDRYRRVVAHAGSGGRWLQGELVAAGLALVQPGDPWTAALLALEERARDGRRGLWGDGTFRVRSAEAVGRFDEGFAIVAGTVRTVERRAGATYLNFGTDWRRDFTVAIPAGSRAALAAAGLRPDALVGRALRVRGEMVWRNGPLIELRAPAQLELAPLRPEPGR